MTIQVGHSLGCPTFFFVFLPWGGGSQRVNRSKSQQICKLASQQADRSDKSDSSDVHKCKSPLAPKKCAICSVYQS